MFAGDAREFLQRLAKRALQRLGQKTWIEAVGVVKELALAADKHGAAALVQLFVAEFVGTIGEKAAVIPGEFDRRHVAARRKLVKRHGGAGIRSAVERRRDCLDGGGQTEVERPDGVVD